MCVAILAPLANSKGGVKAISLDAASKGWCAHDLAHSCLQSHQMTHSTMNHTQPCHTHNILVCTPSCLGKPPVILHNLSGGVCHEGFFLDIVCL